MIIPSEAMTHAGKFHADDVFSTALLRILNPRITVRRAYDVPEGYAGIVYDIGGGKFDHHQDGAEVRESGVPYAAFGLLWREFGAFWLSDGDEISGKADADKTDKIFVAPLDLSDNTGEKHPLADVIREFNLCWDEKNSEDRFFEAVEFAKTILENKKEHILAERRARIRVEFALGKAQKGIVFLAEYVPWKSLLSGSGACYVVYPSMRGGFAAQTVGMHAEDGTEYTYKFPSEWAGKTEEQLPILSGVETLKFCHNSRFLITTKTKEDAIKACEMSKKMYLSQKTDDEGVQKVGDTAD